MKQAIILFSIILTSGSFCRAQGDRVLLPASFEDSVRVVLENTRSLDATVVGAGFFAVWNQLGLDQQMTIKKQTFKMRKKKFPLKTHLVNYFGAIVNAINIEKADASTLGDFLKVTEKVIEKSNFKQAQQFFAASRAFFQHHALHYGKGFRLYAQDDAYKFDYIENIPDPSLSWNEPDTTTATEDAYPQDPLPLEEIPATDFADNQDLTSSTSGDFLPSYFVPAAPPVIEGPVLEFGRITLNFVTAYDSVYLRDTKGTFSLFQDIFVGEGGSFDWTSAGFSPDSVRCNMTTYNFNVRKAELKTEVVKLNYLGKTPGFIPGSFEFKSQPRKDSTFSSYPRFRSYQSDLVVNGIADDRVRYKGGFSLIGNRISSTSATGNPATIEVYHEGEKKFTAQSPEFYFAPGSIVSDKTKINIHQGNDSLVHQMVRMKYTYADSTQRLLLQKDKGDMRNAPYSSTFFNIDFATDVIHWDLYADSLNMQIDGARNTVPLIIESIDFYDPEDYRLLKGVGFSFHPLALAANYALKNDVREFYSGDLSQASGRNSQEIRQSMEFLRQKGLVNYDIRTDRVQVKQKAIDLFLAFKGEEDYDNLKIHSVTDEHPNATINFEKRNMIVRGVEEFDISDSLNVHIVPDSSVITILQNRDIQFDGTVSAGNFEISGKGFTLKYDSFFISLTNIDSINFFVTEKNARGQEIRRKVNNSMVGADSASAAAGGLGPNAASSSGTLFISRANNKSGKLNIPGYPRLDAATGGVIYFDREEVLGGVYDRSMFFVVPPFKIDSLNNADPLTIKFDGTFVSSGMFPSIKESLHTMPDKSLGFEHAIPPPGYQLYKGDGKMNGVITMNNRGLRGFGQIDFLAATVSSKEFVFYPDSVIARGNRARIQEKQFGDVLFPQASLPDFQMKWLPKEDKMQLKNLKAPFNFYDSTAQMLGTVTISTRGVAGAGKLETRGTELISREMNFAGKEFGARHARFKVKSDDPSKNLLAGNDIRLKFNLEQNYADISPEIEGTAAIEFPYAQFKTSIPSARWDLAARKITMSKAEDVPIENSYFYTTRKDLDSLRFNAEKAEYDLKTQQLKVSGIPYIIVADAMITPENNEVLIHENARIGTLNNTTIVLDTLNAYHLLTEGVVDIISRNEFSGYATYQYVNLLNDTFAIKMTDFHLEPISLEEGAKKSRRQSKASMQTVAKGSVAENESLVLGAGMFYKGDLTMYATRPALELDGYIKLDIRNIKDHNTWIEYNQSGDETEIVLDFDKAIDESGKRVSAGLHFGSTDNQLYLTFANDKKSEDDDDLFTPSGKLHYDPESKEYRIEDLEKSAGTKLSGKVFAYNDETQHLRFEGPVNLYSGTKNFNITSTAIGTGNFETNEIRMNSLLMVNTDVPPTAFDVMARDLQEVIKNEGAEEGLGDQTELLYKIADIVGERAAKDFESRSVQGYVSLGTLPELAKPLVFPNVTLKWSPKYRAFYSEGNIGISNSGKNDINGAFEGFMEVRKTEDGTPVFHVFFKASPESWYYFGIEDNRLLVHSSNEDFNGIISRKTNAGKAKIGEVAFIPGSEEETVSFINRFRKQYLGIDVPYSLYESAAPVETPGIPLQTPPPSETIPSVEDQKQPADQPPVEEQKQDVPPGVEEQRQVTPPVVEEQKKDTQPSVEPGVKEDRKKKDNKKKKQDDQQTVPENKENEQKQPEQKEAEKKKPEDEGF